MSTTDPVSDMLTRIRNANNLGHEVVVMPASKLKLGIAEALKREGYISSCAVTRPQMGRPHQQLTVTLKYGPDGEKVIQFIDRVSTPGRRIYSNITALPKVLSGLGISILSTSSGVLSDREAREKRVGGEVICRVG